jgi:hypothetical protein
MIGLRSRSLGLGLAERERIAALLSFDPSRPFADVDDTEPTGDGRNMGLGELVFTRKLLKPTRVGLMGGVFPVVSGGVLLGDDGESVFMGDAEDADVAAR